jgi:hypothetical protein
MIDEAIKLPLDDSSDFETTLAMYGLASRVRGDPAPYTTRLEKMLGSEITPTLEFLDFLRRGGDPAQADDLLAALSFRTRMQSLHAAVVLLGERAPAAWRTEVSRGLFVGERGYMRP